MCGTLGALQNWKGLPMMMRSGAAIGVTLTAVMACLSMHMISRATADNIPTDGLTVTIAGRAMRCGETPVYMDNEMPTEGMAVPGEGLYLNPFLLNRQPAPVRMFIFKHECAHEVTGPDELGADCMAAQSGAREGWLKVSDIDAVCRSFAGPASETHPSGDARCAHIRTCFAGSQVAGAASPSGQSARASSWSAAGGAARDPSPAADDAWPGGRDEME
jgi:hypothetical protein